jgi:HD superfamily phosphodiesterase
LKEVFEKIWKLAEPYQDQREDDGHARTSLDYALKLVETEDVNPDVVIPAIILHDIGYSQIPQERRMKIFAPDASPGERSGVQYEHQVEGVMLALKILRQVDYPPELTDEILQIISGHDTRKGFISRNEGVVRDADKLWRTSKQGFFVAEERAKKREAERFKRMAKGLRNKDYFATRSALKMALSDLKDRERDARKQA